MQGHNAGARLSAFWAVRHQCATFRFGKAGGISVVSVNRHDMDKSHAAQAHERRIDALLAIAAGDYFRAMTYPSWLKCRKSS